MGYYIQTPGNNTGKAHIISKEYGAVITERPKSYYDVPLNKALICVVNNGIFEAAGYCYNEQEFLAFADVNDTRRKTWLIMDRIKANELTDRKEI